MSKSGISRRDFLQTSGLVTAGVVASSLVGTIVEPRVAWSMATSVLDASQARKLLVMARHLFPHDSLGDQYYAVVVEALDAQAAADKDVGKTLLDGIAKLDGARGIDFLALSDGGQLEVIEALEGTDFFGTVHGATVNNLYGNPLVYRNFGFEGSSVEFGGYLERGFDDAGWLPDV
jgi:hypothetical protein